MTQPKRHHYVFVARCGCPIGLVERREGPKAVNCTTEDQAWDRMYDTRAEEREARARGVRVELVDHSTYVREFYPKMTQACTHG